MNHKTNSGNQKNYGVPTQKMHIDEGGHDHLCFVPTGAKVTATHRFNVSLSTKSVKKEGKLHAMFKLFKGHNELTNVERTIKVNNVNRATTDAHNDEVLVTKKDYSKIDGTDRSAVDFEVMTTFLVDATKAYHIVFQIIELHEHDGHHHHIESTLNNTFHYYQNLNMGTGHEADHLVVERVNICQ